MTRTRNSTIWRWKSATVHATDAGDGQVFLVASLVGPEDAADAAGAVYAQIADVFRKKGVESVHERLFGSLSVEGAVMAARERALTARGLSPGSPVTYIQGRPPWGEGFAGVLIQAVSSAGPDDGPWTIMDGPVPRGRRWRRNGATFLTLQNLHGVDQGSDAANTRPLQAQRMIERAEHLLREQGATYSDVIRTWFYLSDILDWYEEFNEIRNAKYGEFGIMPVPGNDSPSLPASTGIQGNTPQNPAATLDLLAVAGATEYRPEIRQLTNPHQEDPVSYGSAFSRGVLISEPDVSLIQVSGTAAVGEGGRSLCPEDVLAQVGCSLDHIESLVGREGARLEDICSATVFVRHPKDAATYREVAAARGLDEIPALCVVGDICRDELLFEIDAEVAFHPRSRR